MLKEIHPGFLTDNSDSKNSTCRKIVNIKSNPWVK
jgi:hypothetical protein